MKFNVTIASPSPLIAAGSLLFNGTAVWLRSGMPTTTPYTVNFDSIEFDYATGQPSPNALFYEDSLGADMVHNVNIQPASILDTVIIEMDLGDQADAIMSLDDSMMFQEDGFATKGQWTTDDCLGTGRAAGTCHVSEGTGSEFTYEFEGDAITLWGAVESVNSFYTVSIDGLQPTSYSPPNTTSSRPITVLAHASNLGAGSHTLTLTSQPKDGKSRIEIDSVQLYAKTTSGSSTAPSGPSSGISTVPTAAGESSGGLSKSAKIAIIGGVVCGVILLGALLAFIILMRKRNAAAHTRNFSTTYTGGGIATSGIRVDIKRTRTRDDDEDTLAGSVVDMKKDGMELGPLESQTRLPPRW
ncbi:hypothetical protein M407DRAFT_245806 [Tulasnella calospora MUT 4182]|uniref:Mid2 domain-containing protein n=1 Tax=Tulasnella calospora MUT 4182 TaxID=1051891 RepID=A0A0C3LG45_9AGAM|nr:hypothetical protein M407DRAFT_245806 [Tulasnella calospora MUT 4182]